MSTFNEGKHPRGQAGRFTAKDKPGAGVGLDGSRVLPEEARQRESSELGGVTAQLLTSDEDGAVLVQVDTDDLPDGANVRIRLNDGPPVFDGNPERDDPSAGRPLSPGDLENHAAVLGMLQDGARIRWSPDGGETERSGTIRMGTHNSEGERQAFEDIRDSYMRVTADPGVETTIGFTEAADLYASGLLAECG